MKYPFTAITDDEIPKSADPLFQHLLDTYASETNKLIATWKLFTDEDLAYRPHPKSNSLEDILKHQLLSERRFFGEFLDGDEPLANEVLPAEITVESSCARVKAFVLHRLDWLATKDAAWWLQTRPFFDTQKQRIWIFWRRVLHTAHHRTQLTVYLRLLDRPVPAIYGPSADVSWEGADPTITVEAAQRR